MLRNSNVTSYRSQSECYANTARSSGFDVPANNPLHCPPTAILLKTSKLFGMESLDRLRLRVKLLSNDFPITIELFSVCTWCYSLMYCRGGQSLLLGSEIAQSQSREAAVETIIGTSILLQP